MRFKTIDTTQLFKIIANITISNKDKKIQEFKQVFETMSVSIKDLANSMNNGVSLLEAAIQQTKDDSAEIADFLITKGASHTHENRFGDTPLHYAAFHDRFEIIKRLIKAGADLNARNKVRNHEFPIGKTPLDYARKARKLRAIKLLIQKGADISISDFKGIEQSFNKEEITKVFGVDKLTPLTIEQVKNEAEQKKEIIKAYAELHIIPSVQNAENIEYERKELKKESALLIEDNHNKQIIIHPQYRKKEAADREVINSVTLTPFGKELLSRLNRQNQPFYKEIIDQTEATKSNPHNWQIIPYSESYDQKIKEKEPLLTQEESISETAEKPKQGIKPVSAKRKVAPILQEVEVTTYTKKELKNEEASLIQKVEKEDIEPQESNKEKKETSTPAKSSNLHLIPHPDYNKTKLEKGIEGNSIKLTPTRKKLLSRLSRKSQPFYKEIIDQRESIKSDQKDGEIISYSNTYQVNNVPKMPEILDSKPEQEEDHSTQIDVTEQIDSSIVESYHISVEELEKQEHDSATQDTIKSLENTVSAQIKNLKNSSKVVSTDLAPLSQQKQKLEETTKAIDKLNNIKNNNIRKKSAKRKYNYFLLAFALCASALLSLEPSEILAEAACEIFFSLVLSALGMIATQSFNAKTSKDSTKDIGIKGKNHEISESLEKEAIITKENSKFSNKHIEDSHTRRILKRTSDSIVYLR
jgi:hypothetical protein